jgi:hypothetical protein
MEKSQRVGLAHVAPVRAGKLPATQAYLRDSGAVTTTGAMIHAFSSFAASSGASGRLAYWQASNPPVSARAR